MILVNSPGDLESVYRQLQHATWHGLTFADVIAPAFLFVVGVAITLSFKKRLASDEDKTRIILHILRRSIVLFFLGVIPSLYAFLEPSAILDVLRFTGILQRIAICYLVASAIYLWTGYRGQATWLITLLAIYWGLIILIPVHPHGPGVLEKNANLVYSW